MNELLELLVAGAIGVVAGGAMVARRTRSRRSGAAAAPPETRSVPVPPEGARIALDILEHMSEGVLVLDEHLRPSFGNAAARRMLGLRPGSLPAHLTPPQLIEGLNRALTGDDEQPLIEIAYPARLSLRIQAASLQGGAVMAVLQDVSEELRNQRIRREFVAHASHELKSPVASLQALTEAVVQALRDDPVAVERFSGKLLAESHRLGKLVADLLDLSRLEETTVAAHERFDLALVAKTEMSDVSEEAAARELRLEGDIAARLEMTGDSQQVALLIRNLLGNAIQYTQPGGSVKLAAYQEGPRLVLRVEDTGMGIPLEAQSRVFERFYRVDRARSRDRGGTGLGLAIVKHVAELHDATIDLESEVGRGSTFEVSFPRDGENLRSDHEDIQKESA